MVRYQQLTLLLLTLLYMPDSANRQGRKNRQGKGYRRVQGRKSTNDSHQRRYYGFSAVRRPDQRLNDLVGGIQS